MVPAEAVEPVGQLERVELVRTIDGDTIVVRRAGVEEHVRLIGIDAPELREGTVAAFAAAHVVAEVLAYGDVFIELDPSAGRDAFGRTLAWVWWDVDMEEDFRQQPYRSLLQLTLLIEGHAEIYTGETSSRYDLVDCAARNDGGYRVPQLNTLRTHSIKTTKLADGHFAWRVEVDNPARGVQFAAPRLSLWADADTLLFSIMPPQREFAPGRSVLEFSGLWPFGGTEPVDPIVQFLDYAP